MMYEEEVPMRKRGFYKVTVGAVFMSLVINAGFFGESIVNAATTKYVSTSKELISAIRNASPGDEIVIAPGTYTGALGTGSTGSGLGSAWFYSNVDGTKENPITVRAEDENNKPVLRGSWTSATCMVIEGDYWKISGLEFTNAQKGLILDNSNNSTVTDCVIHDVQQEGLHLRDGSSNNKVENCLIYNTGMGQPGFGEGIYIGSDKGKWSENTGSSQGFNKACDNNIISACEIGPQVAGEHIDIKEGTTGTIIENCIMHGKGISGQNYADSFIDAKGNGAIVRGNKCYQEDNEIITDAFQTHQQVEGWGVGNIFIYNQIYIKDTNLTIVNGVNNAAAFAYGNVSYPATKETKGNVTLLTKEEADKYAESTQKPPLTNVSVKIDGYQISTTANGHRTVYSVAGKKEDIAERGIIYCVDTNIKDSEITYKADGSYTIPATEKGLIKESDDHLQNRYAMTMLFTDNENYMQEIRTRAYAVTRDGETVYSDVKKYTIFAVADKLYKNFGMSNLAGHNYLYDKILQVAEPNYGKVEYPLSNVIVD